MKQTSMESASASSGMPFPRTPEIVFANWREALHQGGFSSGVQNAYAMAVQGYLDDCAHVMNRPGLGVRSPLDVREVES